METIKFIDGTEAVLVVRCKECKWAKANGTYQWCGRLDSTARITADEFCSYGEPKTQTKTQNSNLTFEKDECAKEYEELGLKELKELIEADRKESENE